MKRPSGKRGARRAATAAAGTSASARPGDDQIAERLAWTPKQRLDYLLDMLDFEERARRAPRIS